MILGDRLSYDDCVEQIAALAKLAGAAGASLRYVKPHGALYNRACRDDAYAEPVVRAAVDFRLAVMGLPNSRLQAVSAGRCAFVTEGFADRRYLPDGSLVPRSQPDAFVENPVEAVQQAQWLLREPRMNEMMQDLIRDSRTRQRGYFRAGFFDRLMALHAQHPNCSGKQLNAQFQ